METILGAGGPVARALAEALRREGRTRVRLVGRHPRPLHPEDEVFPADLTDPEATTRALVGSRVAYLTVGLPYRTRVWAKDWPRIMENVIRAAGANGTRLVFFDNVYMYAPEALGAMTEKTPWRPASQKGALRARVAERLLEAMERKEVEALIARSADFYGPGRPATGLLNRLVFEPLSRGKPALWLGRLDRPHSFTYLPDAGRALAALGASDAAFGEVWHLPTPKEAPTGAEWIQAVAGALGTRPKARRIGRALAWLAGRFDADVRESREMIYQYERPYVFKSEKIAARLGLVATPIEAALAEVARKDYGAKA